MGRLYFGRGSFCLPLPRLQVCSQRSCQDSTRKNTKKMFLVFFTVTPEGEESRRFGLVPWPRSSSASTSSWELTALLEGKLAAAPSLFRSPKPAFPEGCEKTTYSLIPPSLPTPLNYSGCQKRWRIDSHLHPLNQTWPCLLRFGSNPSTDFSPPPPPLCIPASRRLKIFAFCP